MVLPTTPFFEVLLVRLTTERVTNSLPKLSLIITGVHRDPVIFFFFPAGFWG